MKLSIITINYNNAQGLRKTIDSVMSQSFADLEYIVIDGGSSDNSAEVIKSYDRRIAYWVSEPDKGVYHAMNKGLDKARGEYVLMLNSGDYLIDSLILDQIFATKPSADIIYGDILWDDHGRRYETKFTEGLTFQFFRNASLGHQTTFIRRELHEVIGLYDERYRIVSDWKFFILAIFRYKVSLQHISLTVSVCGRDGLSCLPENWAKVLAERESILKTEFPGFLADYAHMDKLKEDYRLLNRNILIRISNRLKNIFN
jgi:glycosyltransferase involved in cell wall biosynthesis